MAASGAASRPSEASQPGPLTSNTGVGFGPSARAVCKGRSRGTCRTASVRTGCCGERRGTGLSNRRSKEALEESRSATRLALWSAALEAVQRLATANPWTQDLSEPFANMRVSLTALVDGLAWGELAEWLATEHQLGASLMRAGQGRTVDPPPLLIRSVGEAMEPFIRWGDMGA